MNVTFRILSIGEVFHYNGNRYTKRSTRTAKMIGYDNRTFYFGQFDSCTVGV